MIRRTIREWERIGYEKDGDMVKDIGRDYALTVLMLPMCENRPATIGSICRKRRYVETLPIGAAHSVLDTGDSHDEYFLMEDHQDNSLDGRYPWTSGGGRRFRPTI